MLGTRLIPWMIAVGTLGAQGDPHPRQTGHREPVRLSFGVYTSERATTMYETFAPVLEELSHDIGSRLSRKVSIHLRVYKSYDDALLAFTKGEVDFVRFGPASYVIAKQQAPGIRLLAAEQEDGQKRCKGVIVVRADSEIHSLSDLKGKKVAFGDDNSTIGRYLAQAELASAGLHAGDLAKFAYLGRHDKVAKAVEMGDFDAGPVHIATYETVNETIKNPQSKLRVIATFENVGKPWIARSGLDDTVCKGLSSALLAMSSKRHLDILKVNGFLPAQDQDYDLVRRGMKRAEEFEEIPATPGPETASRPTSR